MVIRLLPTYIGSKMRWISYLEPKFKGSDIVELFAGSSIISINLGKTAILNDSDPMLIKILKNYDQMIIPDSFSKEDYYQRRKQLDWYRYAIPLQQYSFSGVFRYSKNGFNVPIGKPISINIGKEYKIALARLKSLNPVIVEGSYDKLPQNLKKQYNLEINSSFFKDKVVVSDPPYESSQASYNSKNFDYIKYWHTITKLCEKSKSLIVFDRADNLQKRNIPVLETKKMRVRGKLDLEGIAIYENGWLG